MLKGAGVILVLNNCVSMQLKIRVFFIIAYENMVAVAKKNLNGCNIRCACTFGQFARMENVLIAQRKFLYRV